MVTKVNRTAEIMFNTTSTVAVGTQVAEFLGIHNNHFLGAVNTLTSKAAGEKKEKKNDDDGGQIGGGPEPKVILPENLS